MVLLALAGRAPGQESPFFPHGVASGDVTASTAICWTRTSAAGDVIFELARDEAFTDQVVIHVVPALGETDFTVKVDVTGLPPATSHFFRFRHSDTGQTSPVGRFRTAPPPCDPAAFRFVYSGDSNAAHRPFHVLTHAATENAHFWFWAGDTAYCDGSAGGLPPAIDVQEYRAKHRQNREDAPLRMLLSTAPVWVQWDDHEVANNYDGGDIEPEIGPARAQAGQQAFFDYMPIRPQGATDDPLRIYRSFRYGALAEFFILDCRRYRSADAGRAGGGPDPRAHLLPTFEPGTIIRLHDRARTMLGREQLEWLQAGLAASTATWKFVLSSVPISSLLFLPYDRWDGYDAERYELLRFIDARGISGVVFLSADIHANAYNPDVTHYLRASLGQAFSPCFRVPEFIAGPVATATFRGEIGGVAAAVFNTPFDELAGSLLFNLGYGVLQGLVQDRVRYQFIEPDRFAYLVVDVASDGLTLTHKGIGPGGATDAAPAVLNEVRLAHPGAQSGCGAGIPFLPICLAAGAALIGRSRRLRRPGSAIPAGTGGGPGASNHRDAIGPLTQWGVHS